MKGSRTTVGVMRPYPALPVLVNKTLEDVPSIDPPRSVCRVGDEAPPRGVARSSPDAAAAPVMAHVDTEDVVQAFRADGEGDIYCDRGPDQGFSLWLRSAGPEPGNPCHDG